MYLINQVLKMICEVKNYLVQQFKVQLLANHNKVEQRNKLTNWRKEGKKKESRDCEEVIRRP
jgi:hypothetical protein